MPVSSGAFGATSHKFELGTPLTEAAVAEFEERHEATLPAGYRLFVTELGDGGAGPGYHLPSLIDSCGADCRPRHLARPSPYLPGPRYPGDWEQRHEEPPEPGRIFLPGTLKVADSGCTLVTQLVVTGPARGRLVNLDCDGPVGPYVTEDADFLAWYERWLDEAAAGYDVGWFGERLPLEEPELIGTLAGDPSPERRARAGESLLQLPAVSDRAWTALSDAMAADDSATVRATLWDLLKWRRYKYRHRQHRGLRDAEAAADDIAGYARSRVPLDIEALSILGRLTASDALAELAESDLERRRRAAYGLAWRICLSTGTMNLKQGVLDDAVGRLLRDADPLLRLHGITAARRFRLASLYPQLRDLRKRETDPWVWHNLSWQDSPWDDNPDPATQIRTEELPF